MPRLLRLTGLLLVLVAVGISSFLITRALFFGPGGLEMVVSAGGPKPTPVSVQPTFTPTDPSRMFEGNLNGFQFSLPSKVDYAAYSRTWSPKCITTDKGNNVRKATEEEWRASKLNFATTYLPTGAMQTNAVGNACEDDVIIVQKDYGATPYTISVSRLAGPPVVIGNYPRERLEATIVGGRPAVIVHSQTPNGRMSIHMRDSFSEWKVSGFQISLQELIKVAEGVK